MSAVLQTYIYESCLSLAILEIYVRIFVSVYANAIQDNLNVILYPGLIEELVDIVEIPDTSLVVSQCSLSTKIIIGGG